MDGHSHYDQREGGLVPKKYESRRKRRHRKNKPRSFGREAFSNGDEQHDIVECVYQPRSSHSTKSL